MRRRSDNYGVLALWFLALAALCFSFIGCAAPTAPSRGPLRLALAGQSNSILLRPHLGETVVAFYGEVTGIAPCWEPAGGCWGALRPQLSHGVDAFIWSQGEYDVLFTEMPVDAYRARQADLFARVGALPVVLEMGPMFSGPRGGVLGPQYQRMKRESGALWIETADLAWSSDGVHMTPEGYAALAARIVARVQERAR